MDYQVAIIGGGPAGYTAAEAAARAGFSVVLFEKRALGGVCLNEGCIPTKTLLYSAMVWYDRHERFAGQSKYPLKKMLSFAIDGITSFSTRPLRYITYLGLLFVLISIATITYALFSYMNHDVMPGWTSLLVSVWFVGGSVLLACGIIGEYVGKMYKEVKRRPHYFVEKEVGERFSNTRMNSSSLTGDNASNLPSE